MSRFNPAILAFLFIIFINPKTVYAGPTQEAKAECKTPITKACRKVCKNRGWKHNTATVLDTCRNSKASVAAYKKGKKFYDQGNHKEALPFFQKANKLWPAPIFSYSMARCYEALGQYEKAIVSYNRYLDKKPMNAADIQIRIQNLQKKVDAARPKPKPVVTKLKPKPVVKPKPKPILPPPPKKRFKRIAGWSAAGAAAAAFIAGGVCLGMGNQKADSVANWLKDGGDYNNNVIADESLAQRLQIGGYVTLGVGVALAVTSVTLLVLDWREAALIPTITPTRGGGALTWGLVW